MGRILSVSMQKGGTGKTTTSINLGAALVERGYSVLLWDLDPQGGMTVACGYDPDDIEQTVYNVLIGEADPRDIILSTNMPGLNLAPADWNLLGLELEITNLPEEQETDGLTWELTLKNILVPVEQQYDFLLIDNPPHPGPLTVLALMAAHTALIPVQTEALSLRALKQLYKLIADIQMANPALEIKILRTKFDKRKKHHQEVFDEIAEQAPDHVLETYVKEAVVLADSISSEYPVVQFAPNSEAAGSYRQLVQELLHAWQAFENKEKGVMQA